MTARTKLGKHSCAGIMSVCPVCAHSINPVTDAKAVFIGDAWFHGACSRFANLVQTAEQCPVCNDNITIQQGDISSGRWWLACRTCGLPIARWADFPSALLHRFGTKQRPEKMARIACR